MNSRRFRPVSGRVLLAPVLVAVVFLADSSSSLAQSPEYYPEGVRWNSLLLFPRLELSETYNDNIFLTESNETDDFITRVSPEIELLTDWENTVLSATVGAETGIYADSGNDDYLDYWLTGSAYHDPTPATSLFIEDISYWHLHEDRGSDDAPALASEPTEYTRMGGRVGVRYKPSLFGVTVTGGLYDFHYDDTATQGGAPIAGSLRDRVNYETGVRLGYDVQDDYEAYIQANYKVKDYDQSINSGGLDRSSEGYEILAGLAFQPTPLIRADVGIGYLYRQYDDPTLDDINGPSAQVNFFWDVSPLTDVGFFVFSRIDETTAAGSAGKLVHGVMATVDHELLPNLVLDTNLGYRRIDYQGGTLNREDDDINFGLGGTYYLSRIFSIGAGYDYAYRDSSLAGNSFTANSFTLSVAAQF